MVDVETLAKILEEDDRWLADHYDELIDQYAGKVIAIENGQIIAIGDSWEEIRHQLPETTSGVMPHVIDVPFPEQLENLWI